MKITRLLLPACLGLAVLAPSAAVRADEPPPADAAQSARDRAVADYLLAAGQELGAFHEQLEARKADWDPQRYGSVKAKLDECDRLLARLKAAPAAEFDRLKARYEDSRKVLVEGLNRAS